MKAYKLAENAYQDHYLGSLTLVKMSTKGICANCRMKDKPLRKINPMCHGMKVLREGQRDGKIGQVKDD